MAVLWLVIVVFVVAGSVLLLRYAAKKDEEKRVNLILACKKEWGEEICQWLIDNKVDLNNFKTKTILGGFKECGWSFDICKQLFAGRIAIGMTNAMVLAALGRPTSADNQEITETDCKIRYVYEAPPQEATYIWFENGQVTKIKIP